MNAFFIEFYNYFLSSTVFGVEPKKAIENKIFEKGTIDGYTVSAIDGTKFFGSNKKSCPECLRNKTRCFHSAAVMSIVGD